MNNRTIANNKIISLLKAVFFCISFIVLLMFFSAFKSSFPPQWERIVYGIMGTLSAAVATLLYLKLDKKKLKDIGLFFERPTLTNFVVGILVGIVIMGSLTIAVLYFSQFQVLRNQQFHFGFFLIAVLPLIPLAFMEELAFRAYPLQILQQTFSPVASILFTAILFAFYHIVNGWSIQDAFLGTGTWGIIFGIAALYSKGIAMPTGVHFAANLTSSVFGNHNNPSPIWIVQQNEINFQNGQANQLASILSQIAMLIFAISCLYFFSKKKWFINPSKS